VGLLVDRWLGTLPLFLLVGLVVGFVAGLYYVYRALKSLEGR
jgi:ATP synthase protein I